MLRLSVDGNILREGDDTLDRSLHPPSKLRRRSRPFSLRDREEEEDAAHTRGKMWPSHLLFAAAQKPATLSAIMTRARAPSVRTTTQSVPQCEGTSEVSFIVLAKRIIKCLGSLLHK